MPIENGALAVEDESVSMTAWSNRLAIFSLIGLLMLCLCWETWLAPLRPGGSALSFKALPLLFPLFGILHGKRYTHQWTSMLTLAYFIEGVVRAVAETGMSRYLATLEIFLATLLFVSCVAYAHRTAPSRQTQP
jgi:uncharacterized membrane protein